LVFSSEPAGAARVHDVSHCCVCRGGLCFPSPRLMEPYTEVSINLRFPQSRNGDERLECSGYVVGCTPLSEKDRSYWVYLLLADLPKSKAARLRRFARGRQLWRCGPDPAEITSPAFSSSC